MRGLEFMDKLDNDGGLPSVRRFLRHAENYAAGIFELSDGSRIMIQYGLIDPSIWEKMKPIVQGEE